MRYLFDIHVHTNYSYDGFIKVERIGYYAKKIGLNGIAITDHDTFKGVKDSIKHNIYEDVEIIPGEEVRTNWGDILCLCIKEGVKSRYFFDVIKEVTEQGGITILPHPFKDHHRDILSNLENIDGIEVINGRERDYREKVEEIISRYPHLIEVGGSDAHLPWEIGQVITIIDIPDNCGNLSFCEAIKKYKSKGAWLQERHFLSRSISIITSKVKKRLWGERIVKGRL